MSNRLKLQVAIAFAVTFAGGFVTGVWAVSEFIKEVATFHIRKL